MIHPRLGIASPRRAANVEAMVGNLYLAVAILAEIVATSALKAAEGFARPWFAAAAALFYVAAFAALAMALRTVPLGVAYAIWSGVGIAALALIGWLVYRQPLGWIELAGIGLIGAGIVVLQLARAT